MGYLGAVIGAGFASGQEIMQFFVAYGVFGLNGVIIAGSLFAVAGAVLLYTAHRLKVDSYQNILEYILGKRMGLLVDFLLAIFLFLGISMMLSASGAVFYEHLYLSKNLGIIIAYALIVFLLFTGKKGLIQSYNILVPLKVILLLFISGYVGFFVDNPVHGSYTAFLVPQEAKFWIIASILYVAYNFSLAMVVLTEYQSVSTAKNSIIGVFIGGLILGLLVLLNFIALYKFMPMVMHYEVPMLYVAGNISITAKNLYTVVLLLGILTTAIANAYGFSQRFSSFTGIKYEFCLVLCMTLALPISMQSFSFLVGKIYPLFGIIGVLILATLIYKTLKDMGKKVYYNILQLISSTKEV
ncbi:hypothetical protein [Candidatus Syntrophocurvum alkaliphilum]|nr:hypothetical protein [Candidatus Syntrophocurvum alkaliphilum]